MKKIVLFLIIFLFITGCDSKDEYFSKTCTMKVNSNDLENVIQEEVTYNNKDKVKSVEIINTYDGKTKDIILYLKKSLKNYNNNLLKNKNIKIRVITDKENIYVLKYFYDVSKMKSEELDSLDISKNSIRYLKRLKKRGFNCD